MEHDAQCAAHTLEVALLQERVKVMAANLDEAVARTQLLVDQYHAQNVAQAEMAGDVRHIRERVDAIGISLDKDYAYRSEFNELKGQWHKLLGTVLITVLLSVLSVLGWKVVK